MLGVEPLATCDPGGGTLGVYQPSHARPSCILRKLNTCFQKNVNDLVWELCSVLNHRNFEHLRCNIRRPCRRSNVQNAQSVVQYQK
jgi:hypothetical protein